MPVAAGFPIGYCESHLAGATRLAELLGDQAAAADLLARLAIIATNRLQFDLALDYGPRAVAAGRAACDERALAVAWTGWTRFMPIPAMPAPSRRCSTSSSRCSSGTVHARLQHAVFEWTQPLPLAASGGMMPSLPWSRPRRSTGAAATRLGRAVHLLSGLAGPAPRS